MTSRAWILVLTVAVVLVVPIACGPTEDSQPDSTASEFLDPVVEDGGHYRLEFENDYLRVLRENLAAGAEGAMHSHRARVSVYLKDATVELIPRDGEPAVVTLVAGTASWGDPVTHRGRPKSDVHNLSIELQQLGGEPITPGELDATLADPEHHITEIENDRVRVVRMTYPPGETSPLHDHPPGFAVFLTDAHLKNVPEQGEATDLNVRAGETRWGAGGPPHTTENVGDTEAVVIRVEMLKEPS